MKFNQVVQFAPVEGSDNSQMLWNLIEQLRAEKAGAPYAPLKIIFPGDPQEKEVLESCYIEDSAETNKEFPYSDFLCTLHKLIRNKLSS